MREEERNLIRRLAEREPGGLMERGYQKICALSQRQLDKFLPIEAGNQTLLTKVCSPCQGDSA